MTILQIVPSYKPAYVYGGPIYSISALCEAQAALGHQVFVFTTNANGANNLDVPLRNIQSINKVAVVYFPRITGDHTHISPKLWFKLFKDANKYDIVHLHSWWSVLMIGCAWILKLKGIKFVFSPRGMFSDYSFNHNINPIKKGIFFNLLTKLHLLRKSRLKLCLVMNQRFSHYQICCNSQNCLCLQFKAIPKKKLLTYFLSLV
jgi:glycosyltransferase involved in cell wall biosynthesis